MNNMVVGKELVAKNEKDPETASESEEADSALTFFFQELHQDIVASSGNVESKISGPLEKIELALGGPSEILEPKIVGSSEMLESKILAAPKKIEFTIGGPLENIKSTTVTAPKKVEFTIGGPLENIKSTTVTAPKKVEFTIGGPLENIKSTTVTAPKKVEFTIGGPLENIKSTTVTAPKKVEFTIGGPSENIKSAMGGHSEKMKSTTAPAPEEIESTIVVAASEKAESTITAAPEKIEATTVTSSEEISSASVLSSEAVKFNKAAPEEIHSTHPLPSKAMEPRKAALPQEMAVASTSKGTVSAFENVYECGRYIVPVILDDSDDEKFYFCEMGEEEEFYYEVNDYYDAKENIDEIQVDNDYEVVKEIKGVDKIDKEEIAKFFTELKVNEAVANFYDSVEPAQRHCVQPDEEDMAKLSNLFEAAVEKQNNLVKEDQDQRNTADKRKFVNKYGYGDVGKLKDEFRKKDYSIRAIPQRGRKSRNKKSCCVVQ